MAARFRHKQPKQLVRSVSKTYLVVCEGQTEEFYLKGFKNILSREKQRTLKIEPIKAQSPDCLKVVSEAIERKKDAVREGVAYEEVWAFFDDDNQSNLQRAFELAKKNQIRVAYSSISIEFWFLLHFEYSARSFMKGDEVTDALRKKGWPEYHKPAFDSWAKLQDKFPLAVQHALRLRKEVVESQELALNNPFTNIDLLLSSIGLRT